MDSSKDQKTHDVPSNVDDSMERPSSPGKIFIGGLSRIITTDAFTEHFSRYGELKDSIIMKDRVTGQPRGFGFVTYADPSVVDKVIEDTHILDGKTVEIKRTIPRGNTSKGPRTRKIFVGGIPKAISDDEFKNYFDKFGKVAEHQIMRDQSTGKSRGFGFITFDSEQVVEEIISKGKMVEVGGKQVEIKKAEPKKPLPDAAPIHGIDSRPPYVHGGVGAFRDSYSGYGGSGYGSNPYMSAGGYSGRPGGYAAYGGSEYGRGYGGYGVGSLGCYEEDPARGYGVRPASDGEVFGGYGSGMIGGYRAVGYGYGANGDGGSFNSSRGVGGAYGSGRGGSGSRNNGLCQAEQLTL